MGTEDHATIVRRLRPGYVRIIRYHGVVITIDLDARQVAITVPRDEWVTLEEVEKTS